MILLNLFLTFFKIGAFSFGGGYAMISLLQHEAVSRGWLTVSEFSDIVAVSQITPGPIAVNMATFVGFRQASVTGSLIATLGVALPSFILVLIVVRFIAKFNESKYVNGVFYGLRPAVAGLIAAASFQIAWPEFFPGTAAVALNFAELRFEFRAAAICIIVFIAIFKFKANPILMILLSAVAGLILF